MAGVREFEIKGMAELGEALKQLGEVAGMRVLISAGRKAFTPVLEEAKRLAAYDEEADPPHLRDSLALTTRKAGYIGKEHVATVGIKIKNIPGARKIRRANRKARELGISKEERKSVGLMPKNPRRYFHLVELGTAHSAPRPFLRTAFDYRVEHALAILRVELKKKIAAAVRRRLRGESTP